MVKTEQEIKTIISKYLQRLQEAGIPVEVIVMYGSYAQRNPREHSDLDLAVISPRFSNLDIVERQILLSRASCWGLNIAIEPLGYTPRELRNVQKGTLLHEIIRTGKTIFETKAEIIPPFNL